MANETLLEQEKAELRTFDEKIVVRWGELLSEQNKEMESLGVPYFGGSEEENKRRKMVAFLEDLISGESDTA